MKLTGLGKLLIFLIGAAWSGPRSGSSRRAARARSSRGSRRPPSARRARKRRAGVRDEHRIACGEPRRAADGGAGAPGRRGLGRRARRALPLRLRRGRGRRPRLPHPARRGDERGCTRAFLDECPAGDACGPRDLPSYWDDADYVAAHRELPVVFVTWHDAAAYCRWAGGAPADRRRVGEGGARHRRPRLPDRARRSIPTAVNILGADRRDEKNARRKADPDLGGERPALRAATRAPTACSAWPATSASGRRPPSEEEPDLRSPPAAPGTPGTSPTPASTTASPRTRTTAARASASAAPSLHAEVNADVRPAFRRRPARSSRPSPSPAPLAAEDDSLQSVIDGGVLRVAAEPGTPPMLFKEGARYDGFDWEVAKAIAKRIGVDDVVIVPGKYSELPGRLIAGKADVIISRLHRRRFDRRGSTGRTPTTTTVSAWWSSKGSRIRSIARPRGKVVGIFNDPAAEEEVKRPGAANYARLEKYEDGYFDLLAEGKIDAFIYDYPYAQEEIKEYDGQLEIVEFNLTQSTYNVGRAARRDDLLKMVNSAIRELSASNEYRQMVRKYLGGTGPAASAPRVVAAGQRSTRSSPATPSPPSPATSSATCALARDLGSQHAAASPTPT